MHISRASEREAQVWGRSYGRKEILFCNSGRHSVVFAPATIEVARCEFTKFPQRERFFFVLKGELGLYVDGTEINLAQQSVPLTRFSGEAHTECVCRTPNASAFNVIHSRNVSVKRIAHGDLKEIDWNASPVPTLDSIFVYGGRCDIRLPGSPPVRLCEGDALIVERKCERGLFTVHGGARILAVSVNLN